MLHTSLQQLGLLNNLNSHDEFALSLTSEVHVSELATTQRTANFEIFEAP